MIAVDLLPIDPIPGVIAIEADFLEPEALAAISDAHGGERPDVVLSDMAAPTTGHRKTDALRTANLYEAAAAFAVDNLAPGGAFFAKVFRGGMESALLADLKRRFDGVAHVKPKASRPDSVELYLLAQGFRG